MSEQIPVTDDTDATVIHDFDLWYSLLTLEDQQKYQQGQIVVDTSTYIPPPTHTVPEPDTMWLLGLVVVAALVSRWRSRQ